MRGESGLRGSAGPPPGARPACLLSRFLSLALSLLFLLSHPLVSLLARPGGALDNELNVGLPDAPEVPVEHFWSGEVPASLSGVYPGRRAYEHPLLILCAGRESCLDAAEHIRAVRAAAGVGEAESAPAGSAGVDESPWPEGEYSYVPDVTVELVEAPGPELIHAGPWGAFRWPFRRSPGNAPALPPQNHALVALILRKSPEERLLTPARSLLAPKQGNSEQLWLYQQALRLPRPAALPAPSAEGRDVLISHRLAFSAFRLMERTLYALQRALTGPGASGPSRLASFPARFRQSYSAFLQADVSSLNWLAVRVYESFSMLRALTSSLLFRARSPYLSFLSELASPVLVEYAGPDTLGAALHAAAFLAATQQYLPQYGLSAYLYTNGARVVPAGAAVALGVAEVLGRLLLCGEPPWAFCLHAAIISLLLSLDPLLAFLLLPGVWALSRGSVVARALGVLLLADCFVLLPQARPWVCAFLAQEATRALAEGSGRLWRPRGSRGRRGWRGR